jgi:hypothetical protein
MPGELEALFRDDTWYNARIAQAKIDESSNSGTPGIIIDWMVTEGEMAGKYIHDERWISEANAARHRKEFLEVLEYDLAKEDLTFIAKLEGQEAAIKVKIEEWPTNSGRKRPKINRIRKKGEFSQLSPTRRLAKIFDNEATKEDEWEKEKKF